MRASPRRGRARRAGRRRARRACRPRPGTRRARARSSAPSARCVRAGSAKRTGSFCATVERDLGEPVVDPRVGPAAGELRAVVVDVDAWDRRQRRDQVLVGEPLGGGDEVLVGPGVGDGRVAEQQAEVGQQRVGAVEQAQLERLVRGARLHVQRVPRRPRAGEVLDHPLPERLGDDRAAVLDAEGAGHRGAVGVRGRRARRGRPSCTGSDAPSGCSSSSASTSPLRGRLSSESTVTGSVRRARPAASSAMTSESGPVGLLGHGERDHVHLRERGEHRVPRRRRVQHLAHAPEHAEALLLPARDQRVDAVLRRQRVDHVAAPRGDAADPPVARVLRVLAEVRARERPQPEVDDPARGRRAGPPQALAHDCGRRILHVQAPAQVLLGLRVQVAEPAHLAPQRLGQAARAGRVDLHQVAGRVAHVGLRDVPGQLDQVAAVRAVERAERLRAAVDRLEILHGDREVVIAARLGVALEHVQLRLAEADPLDGHTEVRRIEQDGVQQLDVEPHGRFEVVRMDTDVVDPAGAHGICLYPAGEAARGARSTRYLPRHSREAQGACSHCTQGGSMQLRTCGAVLATALLALAAAAPAAMAAREPLNAYRVAPTAENKAKLVAAGFDMIEADHGTYLEVYGTAKQAAGLQKQGLAPRLVGKARANASQAADVPVGSDAQYNVWRRYDKVPTDTKEQYLELYDRLEGMSIVKKVKLGTTHMGRDLIALKVTSNAKTRTDNTRPAVLYNAMQHAREWLAGETCRRTLLYFTSNYGKNTPDGLIVTELVNTPRAVVHVRQQPGRLRVHVHARQPPVAQEHGRQQRQRRARRGGRRRRPQPQPRLALGLRQRGLLGRPVFPRPTAAPARTPSPRRRRSRPCGTGSTSPSRRTTTRRPSCCCGRTASSSTRRRPTTSSSRPTRAMTPPRRSPTRSSTPTTEEWDDHREPLRPGHRRRALHHQRRPDRRRVRPGHPRVHARGLDAKHPERLGLRVPGRRGRHRAGVPAPQAVRARPRALGRRSGEPDLAPGQHGRELLRRDLRRLLRRPAGRAGRGQEVARRRQAALPHQRRRREDGQHGRVPRWRALRPGARPLLPPPPRHRDGHEPG